MDGDIAAFEAAEKEEEEEEVSILAFGSSLA